MDISSTEEMVMRWAATQQKIHSGSVCMLEQGRNDGLATPNVS